MTTNADHIATFQRIRNTVLASYRSSVDAAIEALAGMDQAEADALALAEARKEIATDDEILADRKRLLDLFECPVHGACIPYAIKQVELLRAKALVHDSRDAMAAARCECTHHRKCAPCDAFSRARAALSVLEAEASHRVEGGPAR